MSLLVPTDFSAASRQALALALVIAERTGAKVDVLFVWEPSTVVPLETLLSEVGTGAPRTLGEIGRKEALRQTTEFVASVPRPATVPVATRVEVGRPDELIVTLAEQGAYDMIVMGSHGRTGLRRVLMGSVAERVVRTAPCAVLSVKLPDGEAS